MASDQKVKDENWQLPQVQTRPRAPTAKMVNTDLTNRKTVLKVNVS